MKLRIESQKTRKGMHLKGRSFEVELVWYLSASRSWGDNSANRSDKRPVAVCYAATDAACRAFTANFRAGRPAVVINNYGHSEATLVVPRRSGHRWVRYTTHSGLAVMTAYLPELIDLDAGEGIDDASAETVRFIMAPSAAWIRSQATEIARANASLAEEAEDAAAASLFAAFLSRRGGLPIAPDVRFYLQLWRSAQEQRWLFRTSGSPWREGMLFLYPDEAPSLHDAVLVHVPRETLEGFVMQETARFFASSPGWEIPRSLADDAGTDLDPISDGETVANGEDDGEDRSEASGGILPLPVKPIGQLSLFG